MIEMQRHWLTRLLFVCLAGMALSLFANDVSEKDVLFAAGRWLETNMAFWGNDELAEPVAAKRLTNADGNPLPLWIVSLTPRGYIVFSSDDTLPPVVAFNTKGDFQQVPEVLSLMLSRQGEIYQDTLEAEKTRGDSVVAKNLETWNALLSRTRASSIMPGKIIREPMLETEWEQDAPYNTFCPNSLTSSERAVTGCVAVAVGQVMKFHEWPVAGTGSKENVDSDGTIQATIRADFSFPYNWDSIPNAPDMTMSTADAMPLARLLMDAGTMGSANYELGNTSAFSSSINELMPEHLGYASGMQYGDTRKDYVGYTSQSTLYSRIRKDMEESRPAIVSFPGHAFVADGLGTSGGKDYYHLNYGWGGLENGWYLLDDGTECFGYKTAIISATTNIIPKAVPVFKPISVEQGSSFTLEWDFPKRIAAECFRLSMNSVTRASTVISDSISGDARSYELTEQTGTCKYTLEAKVNNKWQAASESVTITIKDDPAPLPTIAMDSVITNIAGEETTTIITSSTTLKSLAVASSRPDILTTKSITISGDGASRTLKIKPKANIYGNVLLYVTATDDAGNIVKKLAMFVATKMPPLVWHTSLDDAVAAAEDGQFVLMVAGRDTCDNTNNFRNIICESDDIKTNLIENYSLWYCNVEGTDRTWGRYLDSAGSITLPYIAIIDKANTETKIRGHEGPMGLDTAMEFLSLQNPYFSLDANVEYAPMTTQKLELSVLQSGAVIHYRTDATAPTLADKPYSNPISISSDTTITARAFKDGEPIGDTVTKTYFFLGMVELPDAEAIATGEGISFYSTTTPWFLETETYNSEPSAMQSGRIGDSQSSILIAKVSGAGEIEFNWKASSEEGFDFLLFKVAGTLRASLTGDSSWEKKSFTIKGDGDHFLSWTFEKDDSDYYEVYNDCGWVDDIVWKPVEIPKTTVDGIVYLIKEGEATIVGVEDKEAYELQIPKTVNDVPVTGVADNAFDDCSHLSLVYSDNETVLAWFAVNMPDVVLKGAIRHSETGLTYYVFNGEVTVFGIDEEATELDVPEELDGYPVTKLDFGGIYNEHVESISLPATMTDVGDFGATTVVFLDWFALKRINVAENNPAFASKDGVLYNSDFTVLIRFPVASEIDEFIVPDTVRTLVGGAFYGNVNLKKAILSSTISGLSESESLFDGCTALETVVIPDGIDAIGSRMFNFCTALSTIFVGNDVASISDDAFDECTVLATVYTDNDFVRNWFADKMPGVAVLDVPRVTSHGVIYRLFAGEATLIGVEDNQIEEVVIPPTIEECPVVAIDDAAFEECEDLSRAYTDSELVASWFALNAPDVTVSAIPMDGDVVAADGILYSIQDGTAIAIGHEDSSVAEVIIHGIVADYPVVAIGDEAFSDYRNLTTVIIPKGVTAIGDEAFASCDNLVILTLPDGLLTIGDSAFEFCKYLTPVTLPASLEEIGDSAFWGCTEWTSFEVAEGSEHFASVDGVLYNADKTDMLMYPAGRKDIVITIPDGVTNVSASFYYPENPFNHVYGVVVGNDLTDEQSLEAVFGGYEDEDYDDDILVLTTRYYLPELMFAQTDNEAVVAWLAENRPELEVIGMDAEQPVRLVEEDGFLFLINNGEAMLWEVDEAMVNAVIPASIEDVPVTSINETAFQNMPALESVSIPATITEEFSEEIFDGSPNLCAVVFEDGNPSYASLDGVVYTADFTTLIFYPQGKADSTFVVERVESIEEYAFEDATALTNVTILDNVQTINASAFEGCTSLVDLTVGDGVDYIAVDAFDGCDALATVYTDNLYVIDWFTEHMPDVELLNIPTLTEDGLIYRIMNGEATLIGVEDDDVEEIVIPTMVEDYPVIAIGDTAFEECENLKTVYTDNDVAKLWFAENMPDVNVIQISGIAVYCELAAGWNLITPTLVLDDDSVGKLLDANAMVFDSVNSTYRMASAEDIAPGTALWIFAIEPLEMELCGDYIFDWELQVSSGWNLVGAVKDVAKEELPENVESVWEWNGSKFVDCESMKQGKAYWIFGK